MRMNAGWSGADDPVHGAGRSARRRLPAVVAALVLVAIIPQARAAQYTVEATDDENKTGTCPLTNQFNAPTQGNCFKPETITITAGDTVVWKGTGGRPHDVTADDGSFKGPIFHPGQSWSHTFTTAGTFQYYCSLHGGKGGVGQSGKLIVKPGKAGSKTTTPPKQQSTRTGGRPAARGGAPAQVSAVAVDMPAAAPGDVAVAPATTALVPTTLRVRVEGAKTSELAAARTEAPSSGGFTPGLATGLMAGLAAAWAILRVRTRPKPNN